MATNRSFQAMLNQYLPNDLLREEMVKRDWILNNVEFDNSWSGGDLIVPFKGAKATSVAFGSLTASTDIAEDTFVRGSITSQPEVWGSMVFNHRDLMEHGKVSEQNFLKLLPDTVDEFLDYVKEVVSLSFLNGPSFATLATDGDSSGNFTTSRPERFSINQKVYFKGATAVLSSAGYVKTINMDTGACLVVTARGGSTGLDISAYTVADAGKVYFDGSSTAGLTSLKSSLLSAANGGSSSLYGQTKTAYPYLQSIQISGAAMTSVNILETIFDGYTKTKNRGKGNPSKCVMSYRNLGYIMTLLETRKGQNNYKAGSTKVNNYGWTEIEITGVKGSLTVVGIQECDDDYIMFLDMRAIKVYTNGSFKKRQSPDGIEYFEVRNTSGYQYIVDVAFFGDMVLTRPSYCGIIYGIA